MYIYIAAPYTDDDQDIVNERAQLIEEHAVRLLLMKMPCFSVITFCHQFLETYTLPTDYDFWKSYCEAMIIGASEVQVLMLPGWSDSVGTTDEIKIATERSIPIKYVQVPLKSTPLSNYIYTR